MKSVIYKLKLRQGICQFINGRAFKKTHYLNTTVNNIVYVMRIGRGIIYVGEAGRGFYRCLDGLTAKMDQNIAYPWRNDADVKNSEIEVIIMNGLLPTSLANSRAAREVLETDLTAHIFTKTGSWPSKLTQIKVHGKINRTKAYKNASNNALKELLGKSWL